MIKLFRNLRQEQLKDQKLKMYLLYALGEIFLIVVGILIALQISNWNEKKKARLQGEEMISEIKNGIASDIVELDKFLANQQQVLGSQWRVSKWLKNERPFTDSLKQHLSKAYISTDYSINYSGYETLKRFGLKRVENDSLRASISQLYEVKYPTYLKFINIYQYFLENLLSENPKHFNELKYVGSVMRPRDPVNLKRDKEYAYQFNTLKNFNELLIYQSSVLKRDMQATYSVLKER